MKTQKKSNSVELAGKFLSTWRKKAQQTYCYIKPLSYKSEIPLNCRNRIVQKSPESYFPKKNKNKAVFFSNHFPSVEKHRTQQGSNTWMVSNQPIWKNIFVDLDIFGSISPNFWDPSETYVLQIWMISPKFSGCKNPKHV